MSAPNHSSGQRLNKFLASSGVASRRACDELIREGKVTINGEIVKQLSARVWEDDVVRLDKKKIETKHIVTILHNKPKGFVCTKSDEHERATIYELLPPALQHLNHVGRLDQDSEGLLILTNDGELANTLAHPKTKTEKEYLVTLDQSFDSDLIALLLRGIKTQEGYCSAHAIMRISARRVRVILHTGIKRQIRVMFKTLGFRVKKLVRLRIGSLWGGDLEVGRWRYLDSKDLERAQKNPPMHSKFLLAEKKESPGAKRKAQKKTTKRTPKKQAKGTRNAKKSTQRGTHTKKRK